MITKDTSRKRRDARRSKRVTRCHCCTGIFPFCWSCRCGFAICQECMYENQWGMTCNGITWECPDCAAQNSYCNQ
ncbi:MAG: hypothetical protein HQK66_13710 [Desulfamplus sp.]|nr:hypothetical protein [Desulfamplus sp.]